MMPGPPKITLDQESFKALASEVRVEVLKRLDERRQTVTDLSNLLGLSKPTLLEHLEKLQAAGLVKRVDEGRKWIYYELSDKGRKILHPERVSIVIALATAIGLAAIGIVGLLTSAGSGFLQAPATNGTYAPPEAARGAPIFAGFPILSFLAFLFAGISGIAAFLLARRGRRRRARLFREIVHG